MYMSYIYIYTCMGTKKPPPFASLVEGFVLCKSAPLHGPSQRIVSLGLHKAIELETAPNSDGFCEGVPPNVYLDV